MAITLGTFRAHRERSAPVNERLWVLFGETRKASLLSQETRLVILGDRVFLLSTIYYSYSIWLKILVVRYRWDSYGFYGTFLQVADIDLIQRVHITP